MKRETWLSVGSLGLALAAAVFVLVEPPYSRWDETHTINPTRATLVEVNGEGVYIPVMFPVVVALTPLVFPRRTVRIIATLLICGFTILGSLSIGLYYFPAAAGMMLATYWSIEAKPNGNSR